MFYWCHKILQLVLDDFVGKMAEPGNWTWVIFGATFQDNKRSNSNAHLSGAVGLQHQGSTQNYFLHFLLYSLLLLYHNQLDDWDTLHKVTIFVCLPHNRNKAQGSFPPTVLCTTLVSDVSIPIALPTAADASAATLSVSLPASPAGGPTQCSLFIWGLDSN